MNLTRQQVKAIVDTLEIKFNEENKTELKVDKKAIKDKAKRIVKDFNSLSLETRKYFEDEVYAISKHSYRIAVADVEENIKEQLESEAFSKEVKKRFDRVEVERKVIMQALSVDSIEKLAIKLKIKLP